MINDDFGLIDVVTGYQRAAVITAACRIGIFDALSGDPRAVEDVASEYGLDAGNLTALLRALEPIGLVERTQDGYAASEYATTRLAGGSEMALVVAKEAVFAEAWLDLAGVVATGRPTMESWRSRLESNPAQAKAFLEALDVLARISGPPVASLEVLAPGRRVVDVGGGLGTYAAMLQGAGSSVTLVDLPAVVEWARSELAGTGVECVEADLLIDPSCGVPAGSMDAALVSHMLHDLTEPDAVELLLRVRESLVSGGHVVVNDFAGDVGPGDFGRLFDVMMRVETPGAAHSWATLASLMEEAGFEDVAPLDLAEPLTVLVGRKP